jgi:hypothetical protein
MRDPHQTRDQIEETGHDRTREYGSDPVYPSEKARKREKELQTQERVPLERLALWEERVQWASQVPRQPSHP